MKLSRNKRRPLEKLSFHLMQVREGDRAFFENHPDRQHHIRRSEETEIAALKILSGELWLPPDGQCWFTLARMVDGEPVHASTTNRIGAETGLAVPDDFAGVLFDLAIENLEDAE